MHETHRPLKIDMMDKDSMDAAVARVREEAAAEGLPIIGLCNNAGVSNNAPLEFLPMAKLRQLLETNVVGPTYLTQVLTKDLRASQGRVVQISSVLGVVSMATRGAYSASKHALEVSGLREPGFKIRACRARLDWNAMCLLNLVMFVRPPV